MILEKIRSSGTLIEYRVTIGADTIEDKVSDIVAERRKTFKAAGYRTGDVPESIVRQSVENSAVKDAMAELVREANSKVIADAGVQSLAMTPAYHVTNGPYEKGKDVELIFALDVAPSFELKPMELKIKRIVPKVTDEYVIENRVAVFGEFASFEDAPDDHAIAPGDKVSFKAVCYHNGVKSKKRSFENTIVIPKGLGSEELPPFVGKKNGESFDDSFGGDQSLRYHITVTGIQSPAPTSTPEELAAKYGFSSVQEMDEAVRSILLMRAEADAFLYHKNQILDALSEQYDFDVPERLWQHELRNVISELRKSAPEDVEGKSDDDLRRECGEVAKKRVVLGYLLNKIAQEKGIAVSDDDLRSAIADEIKAYPENGRALLDHYRRNPDAVAYKRATILEYRVVWHLFENAETEDIELTVKEAEAFIEEYFKSDDAQEGASDAQAAQQEIPQEA
jgi:trigger factor